jgi:hypothetical protein
MALKIAGEVLASNAPLGICTLDPEDWAYNGNYNNDDDGLNKATARGWNYHQGPVSVNYQNTKVLVTIFSTKGMALDCRFLHERQAEGCLVDLPENGQHDSLGIHTG